LRCNAVENPFRVLVAGVRSRLCPHVAGARFNSKNRTSTFSPIACAYDGAGLPNIFPVFRRPVAYSLRSQISSVSVPLLCAPYIFCVPWPPWPLLCPLQIPLRVPMPPWPFSTFFNFLSVPLRVSVASLCAHKIPLRVPVPPWPFSAPSKLLSVSQCLLC
jgi:hypothetical protein